MTVATQSESTARQQKLEAEKFLRRVQVEYPHLLLVLGWQAILNASVHGMKQVGVFSDNLTEATFLAGLRHSMDVGTIPKPPAPVPPPPTAEETAAKAETERLAAQARKAEEDARRFSAQTFKGGKHTGQAPKDDGPTALDNFKQSVQTSFEAKCKQEAESLTLYHHRGIDHARTELLRTLFITDPDTGRVNWIETLKARKFEIENYRNAKAIRNR